MTRSHAITSALAAFVVAAGAAIAFLLMPAPAAHAGTGVSASLDLLDAAAPGGDRLTWAQVREVFATANRVCEGFRAEVPLTTMENTVARQSGLSRPQAHRFVAAALETCAS